MINDNVSNRIFAMTFVLIDKAKITLHNVHLIIVIIRLMVLVYLCPKVITLSSLHFTNLLKFQHYVIKLKCFKLSLRDTNLLKKDLQIESTIQIFKNRTCKSMDLQICNFKDLFLAIVPRIREDS